MILPLVYRFDLGLNIDRKSFVNSLIAVTDIQKREGEVFVLNSDKVFYGRISNKDFWIVLNKSLFRKLNYKIIGIVSTSEQGINISCKITGYKFELYSAICLEFLGVLMIGWKLISNVPQENIVLFLFIFLAIGAVQIKVIINKLQKVKRIVIERFTAF